MVNNLIRRHWYPLKNVQNWRLQLNQQCFWGGVTKNQLIFDAPAIHLIHKNILKKVFISSFSSTHRISYFIIHFIGYYIPTLTYVFTNHCFRKKEATHGRVVYYMMYVYNLRMVYGVSVELHKVHT